MKVFTLLGAAALSVSLSSVSADFVSSGRNLDTYKNITLDVCDMINAFSTSNYAAVQSIYENGKNARRGSGAFRTAKAFAEAERPGEPWYDDLLDYGFAKAKWAQWMSGPIYGTVSYPSAAIRNAAGKSWSRLYLFAYTVHEVAAGLVNAKRDSENPNWAGALAELEDAYFVYVGRTDKPECETFKSFLERTSPTYAAQFYNAFVEMQQAINAQDVQGYEHGYYAMMDAAISLMMKAVIDTAGVKPSAADLAAASPFFESIEAYVFEQLSIPSANRDTLQNLLTFTKNAPADFNGKLRSTFNAVSKDNGLPPPTA